jgi:hypothetical protein
VSRLLVAACRVSVLAITGICYVANECDGLTQVLDVLASIKPNLDIEGLISVGTCRDRIPTRSFSNFSDGTAVNINHETDCPRLTPPDEFAGRWRGIMIDNLSGFAGAEQIDVVIQQTGTAASFAVGLVSRGWPSVISRGVLTINAGDRSLTTGRWTVRDGKLFGYFQQTIPLQGVPTIIIWSYPAGAVRVSAATATN